MVQLISQTTLRLIFALRLLIAWAGERDSPAWWNSHALTEQGRWVLSRLVPRHAAYAGVRLAIEAAAVMHREAIGQRPAVTLFGLGADLDARVMRQLELHRMDGEPLTIAPPIRSVEGLRARLNQVVVLTDDDLTAVGTAAVNGHLVELGAITSRTFMFPKSFQKLRENVIFSQARMSPVADLGFGVLDAAMVETVAFVLEKG